MNCDLQHIRQTADGKHLLRCSRCQRELSVRNPAKGYKATCGISDLVPKDGPGTELAGIAIELRVKEKRGCGCAAMRAEMNLLGVDGCRRERDRLADKLREKAPKWGLTEKARAAMAAATSGLALRLNWLDPFPGLIDLAIERAAVNQPPSDPKPLGCASACPEAQQPPRDSKRREPTSTTPAEGPRTE